MELMNQVIEKYDLRGAIVVDMGSYDVNGTYRPLFSGGKWRRLNSKVNLKAKPGDVLRVETPGGGGYGSP